MSMTRNMAALALMGAIGGLAAASEPRAEYVVRTRPDYGPVAMDWRGPSGHVKVGRPWTKAKARNRRRNRIARASRKANR